MSTGLLCSFVLAFEKQFGLWGGGWKRKAHCLPGIKKHAISIPRIAWEVVMLWRCHLCALPVFPFGAVRGARHCPSQPCVLQCSVLLCP